MLDFSVPAGERASLPSQQRVAIVTGSFDQTIDGVALTLNRLAAHLLRRGHAVLVLCPGAPGRPLALRPAARVVRVPSVPLPVWSEYRLTWGLGRSAARALADFSPSVIHVAVTRAPPTALPAPVSPHHIPIAAVPLLLFSFLRRHITLNTHGLRTSLSCPST